MDETLKAGKRLGLHLLCIPVCNLAGLRACRSDVPGLAWSTDGAKWVCCPLTRVAVTAGVVYKTFVRARGDVHVERAVLLFGPARSGRL